ncbi:beta-lactamase family protein [Peribacillus sp. CSMR9]|nr:beta-lactamase family protein [Peribacillus sp. CSMR9]
MSNKKYFTSKGENQISTLNLDLSRLIKETSKEIKFSGVIGVKTGDDLIYSSGHGYSNRSDEIMNTTETRFGIASGCQLFTAITICQLVQKGTLRFDSKLKDCLPIEFLVSGFPSKCNHTSPLNTHFGYS